MAECFLDSAAPLGIWQSVVDAIFFFASSAKSRSYSLSVRLASRFRLSEMFSGNLIFCYIVPLTGSWCLPCSEVLFLTTVVVIYNMDTRKWLTTVTVTFTYYSDLLCSDSDLLCSGSDSDLLYNDSMTYYIYLIYTTVTFTLVRVSDFSDSDLLKWQWLTAGTVASSWLTIQRQWLTI